MTTYGGQFGYGTIFKLYTSNDSIVDVHDFDSINGSEPLNSLTLGADGKLYGVTFRGGIYQDGQFADFGGVIFRFDPVTNIFTKLHDFGGDSGSTGEWPQGALVQLGNGKFYGTTSFGGTYGWGTLFEYDPATDSLIVKHNFRDTLDAIVPCGNLTFLNGKLYGLTTEQNFTMMNDGVLFSYDPDSDIYKIEIDSFYYGTGNPTGGLLAIGNELWGGTLGGSNISPGGSIYQYDPIDSNFAIKADLVSLLSSSGFLMLASDGNIYGLAYNTQGSPPYPILFQYDTANNLITTKHVFDSIPGDGGQSLGGVIQASNGLLYGMTQDGGNNGDGTIFSYDYISNTYTKLIDLSATTGWGPEYGTLIEVDESTGIPDIVNATKIMLYPNPCNGKFILQSCGYNGMPYLVYDMLGELVQQGQVVSEKQNIDMGTTPDGVYILVTGGHTIRFAIENQ